MSGVATESGPRRDAAATGRRTAVVIRQADLDGELGLVVETVNTSFGSGLDVERFRWLYQQNPDGPAIAWFVCDDASGEVVGTTAVCPRRIRVGDGRTTVAWNCCDFSIRQRYRTMGAALKLRRAARMGVDAGGSDFLYAHPNDQMLAIHLAVGHRRLGKMVRHAKALRTSSGWRAVDRTAALALRLAGREWWSGAPVDAELATEWPLAQLDALFEEASSRIGTAIVRDGRYLDWRFRRNPLERSELILASRHGRIAGYLVFTQKGDRGVVKDWLGVDNAAVEALFRRLTVEMRARDAASISVMALESHPDFAIVGRLGFVRRPDWTTAVVYARPNLVDDHMVTDPGAWYMTLGDRDV